MPESTCCPHSFETSLKVWGVLVATGSLSLQSTSGILLGRLEEETIDKRHWLCTDEGTTPASGILFYCLETDSGTTFVKSQAVRAAQPSSFTCELIQSAETQWVSHPKVHLGCTIASWMGGSEKTTLPHTFKFTPTKAKGWMQKQPVIPLFGFWYLQMILLCKFTLKKKRIKKPVCVLYKHQWYLSLSWAFWPDI